MKEKIATKTNKSNMTMKEDLSREMSLPIKEKPTSKGKSALIPEKDLEKRAIGLLETDGFVPFVNAVDAILKAAKISIVGYEKLGNGIIAISINGDIGAVRVAIDAGMDAASKTGGRRVRVVVMPNANPGLVNLIL